MGVIVSSVKEVEGKGRGHTFSPFRLSAGVGL